MYDKEPRFKVPPLSIPGPGYYNLVDEIFPEYPGDHAAPFLTSSSRFDKKILKDTVDVSPNSYRIRNEFGNKPGGYFWLSTSKRFEGFSSPKPRTKSEYNFRLGNGLCKIPGRSLKSIRKSLRVPKCKREPVPPSIPNRKGTNGYEFNPDGTIYKVAQTENDTTIGPAFYNVPIGETCLTTLLYKGNFWSHNSARKLTSDSITPGPGDYDITVTPKRDLLHFPREPLYTPRFLDDLVYNEVKQDTPGPAGYVLPDPLRIKLMDLCCNKAPFSTSAKRFSNGDVKLGPYMGSSPASSCGHFQNSSLAPFGTTSPRFKRCNSDDIPEPNRYTIKSFTEEKRYHIARSKIIARTTTAPFGSNTERMKSPAGPHPLLSQPEKKDLVFDLATTSIPKKTVSKPTKRLVPSKFVYPAPGDHEVTRVMLYLRQKTSHRKPPKRKADPAAFLVSSQRFSDSDFNDKSKFERCKSRKKYNTPGPGAYNISDSKPCPKQGISFTKEGRFPKTGYKRWPGPASYKPAPTYLHTALKPTYNATLNSILPRNYGAKWRPPHFKNRFTDSSF